MQTALRFAHSAIDACLELGDLAVDATVGNGHDTLFLAQRVGEEGHVYGFDIQEAAIQAADSRLREASMRQRVTLFHNGHEQVRNVMPPVVHGRLKAVMFNLGYLPNGGEKTIITKPHTTIAALEALLPLVTKGGLLALVIYEGHPGGAEEGTAVDAFATQLSQRQFQVVSYRMLNQRNTPPRLVLIEKR